MFSDVVKAVPVIYLAGGMRSNWQDEVMSRVRDAIFVDPRTHGLRDEREYTAWDLAGVDRADIVFGYLEADNPGGAGLAVEFGWAAKSGKHIIFAEEAGYAQSRYIGMVRAVADSVIQGRVDEGPVLVRAIETLKHHLALRKLGQV